MVVANLQVVVANQQAVLAKVQMLSCNVAKVLVQFGCGRLRSFRRDDLDHNFRVTK